MDGLTIQEAADKAARRIALSGRVDDEVLQTAIDKVGTGEIIDEAV